MTVWAHCGFWQWKHIWRGSFNNEQGEWQWRTLSVHLSTCLFYNGLQKWVVVSFNIKTHYRTTDIFLISLLIYEVILEPHYLVIDNKQFLYINKIYQMIASLKIFPCKFADRLELKKSAMVSQHTHIRTHSMGYHIFYVRLFFSRKLKTGNKVRSIFI